MSENGTRISIDPHVHSEASFDGKEPIDLILEHAADIGLDAVAITDHDEIDASIKAAEIADDYGLIGVPGVEVSTSVGHLLALGVDERPEENKPLKQTIKRIREMGGAAVIPHPFQRTRHGIKKRKITRPDAIETYNAWIFTGYRNRRAKKYARNRDLPGVASSDAHSVGTVGRAYTEILFKGKESKEEIETQDIVEAIKDGKTEVRGHRSPIHRSAHHYMKAMVRKTGFKLRKLRKW